MSCIQCHTEMIPHVKQVIAGEYEIPLYKKEKPITEEENEK